MAGQSDQIIGLTEADAAEQFKKGYYNKQPVSKTKTVGRIIRDNTFTLYNLLNIVLAVMVLSAGSYKNALFINVVVINMVIGIVQEIRAKRTIDQLSLMSQPRVTVLREGLEKSLSLEEIVLGDVIELRTGNQIPSDSRLIAGEIEVDESLLTGEADAILKKEGDPLLSGSFVVSGEAKAEVEKVGDDNYASKIAADVKTQRKPNSEIMRAINLIVRVVGIVIVPVGILLMVVQTGNASNTFNAAMISTVAALIGMIPEGLVLLTSIALALGVIRLAKYKTLVQELYCIETLARVDVLCLDKTGTITEGCMEVQSVEVRDRTQNIDKIMAALVNALDEKNATFTALRNYFTDEAPDWVAKKKIPFSSARKWSGVNFGNEGTFVIGAPEFILGEAYTAVRAEVDQFAEAGSRVLMLGHSSQNFSGDFGLPEDIKVMSWLVLGDKIREDAAETLAFFAKQGVDIRVISGDSPVTVAAVAKRAGLLGAEHFIDLSTLKTDEEVAKAALTYKVFGRVTPVQKRILVKALKAEGHTVAMTGDGVNDVLALKDADCSIAMAAGSDAARQVAQLVLMENNFSSMTQVLMEGRRVIGNIARAASLFLVKTNYSFLLAILVILGGEFYPFVPIQLTLISALTIAIPSFFLALEPNKRRVTGNFLENVMEKALPGALTIVANIVIIMFLGRLTGLSIQQMSSMACILTGTAGLIILFGVCQPLDRKRTLLFGTLTVAFCLAIVFLPHLFSVIPLYPFDFPMLIILVPVLFCVYPLMLVMRRGVKWLFKRLKKRGFLK